MASGIQNALLFISIFRLGQVYLPTAKTRRGIHKVGTEFLFLDGRQAITTRATLVRLAFRCLRAYPWPMPNKPIELPAEVSKAFVRDMRALHAEKRRALISEMRSPAARSINPRDEERYAKDSVLFFEFAEELRLEKQQGFKNKAQKPSGSALSMCMLSRCTRSASI